MPFGFPGDTVVKNCPPAHVGGARGAGLNLGLGRPLGV